MSEYITMSILISQRDSKAMYNFKNICHKCKEQKQGRVLRNDKVELIKNADRSSVENISGDSE